MRGTRPGGYNPPALGSANTAAEKKIKEENTVNLIVVPEIGGTEKGIKT
jgi:hypothetical protein